MVNRNSFGYVAGRTVGKILVMGVCFLLGARWAKKNMKQSFPEKPQHHNN